MEQQRCDVLVVGGGPAGATCARLAAAAGRAVLLLDARQAGGRKLCGGLLNRKAQAQLDAQGLALPPEVCVAPARPALEYHDLDNRLRAVYPPGYLNIDRARFDAWLLGLAQAAGARVHHGARAQELSGWREPKPLTVATSIGPITADYVVDASGASAFARRRLGLPLAPRLDCLQGLVRTSPQLECCWAVYQSARTPFFSWLIPKADGLCYAGVGLPPGKLMHQRQQRRVRFQTAFPETWDALGWLLDYLGSRGYQWELAEVKPLGSPLAWPARLADARPGAGRVLICGEAAGLVSPFSGEGVSYALASGALAARCILTGGCARDYAGALAPEFKRLKLALLQAFVGARPWLRPLGLKRLPRLTGTALARLPWD